MRWTMPILKGKESNEYWIVSETVTQGSVIHDKMYRRKEKRIKSEVILCAQDSLAFSQSILHDIFISLKIVSGLD